jgi:prepilin-type N-terminal cleavage/methylation domain-containing protein
MHERINEREAGFTLVELLIAITVSGIIISGLSTAFIVAMKGTAGAHDRFIESHGAQTLATYFASDAASANPGMVDTVSTTATGCSGSTPAGTNVVRMQWTEMTTAARMTAFSAAYRMQKVGTDWQLARHFCSASQDLPTTPSAILVGAAPTSHVVAQVLSDPTPPSAYAPSATVLGRTITLNVFAALGAGETAPYAYSLSASMRTPTLFPSVASIGLVEASPTSASTVHWTVTFSEAVNGVDVADFVLVQAGGVSGATISSIAGSGTSYTVTISSGSGSGTLGLNLVDDNSIKSATTANPLGGPASGDGNFPGPAYTMDRTAPNVTVEQKVGQLDPATSLPILYTVTFSEPVTGFDATDVTKLGTAAPVSGWTPSVTGSGADYEISVSGVTGDGTVLPSIAAGRALDLAGNPNAASTSTDNSVTYDAPPRVSSINRVDTSPTTSTLVRWTVIFNKSVTGVEASDFRLVATGAVSGYSISGPVIGSGTTYTVTANRGGGAGTLGLDLADDNSIKDAALSPLGGPAVGDGDFTGQTYQITGTISGVQLLNTANRGVAGKLEQGDQVVVTFARSMDLSSFCSGWTGSKIDGGGASQGASATLENNTSGGNDALKVSTTSGCTFNFGAINLGSADYVTGGNATFSGSGGNATTIAWDATTFRLTITLGTAGVTGQLATVGSSTPVYTADPAIKDSIGGGVTNSPFTLPAGPQF